MNLGGGPKNFWDDLTCKGFNVFVRPVEQRSSNFDSNNNNFCCAGSTKTSKEDYNNNRNYSRKSQRPDEQLLYGLGEDCRNNNIICPCCGHNLGSKWTLVNLRDGHHAHNCYHESHFNNNGAKQEKDTQPSSSFYKSTNAVKQHHDGINSKNFCGTNSNDLSVTSEHGKLDHCHHPLTGYYSQDFNSGTIGTQWPTTTVCDSYYQLTISKQQRGYRSLSELLKVDEAQSSPSPVYPETFQNDWTRNKNVDDGSRKKKKLYMNSSSQTFRQKVENRSEFSPGVLQSSLKRDNYSDDYQSKIVIPKLYVENDDRGQHQHQYEQQRQTDSQMIQAEQNNSRTYLREHRVVQSMRNCWERYLQLQLNAVTEENYYYYDYWRDSLNRSSIIRKQGQGNDTSKSIYNDDGDGQRQRRNESENKFWTLINNISDSGDPKRTLSLKSDEDDHKVTKSPSHQIDSKYLGRAGGGGRRASSCGEERRCTFEEIRIEFEKSAIAYMERIEKENITKKKEVKVLLKNSAVYNKPHDEPPSGKIITSTDTTIMKDTVSPEEKVKNWMDNNDKMSRQNSSNDLIAPPNQQAKDSDPPNLRKVVSQGEMKLSAGGVEVTKNDINFIQLATMTSDHSDYQQHLPFNDKNCQNRTEQALVTNQKQTKVKDNNSLKIKEKPILFSNNGHRQRDHFRDFTTCGNSNEDHGSDDRIKGRAGSKNSKNDQFRPPLIPSLDASLEFETASGS